MNDVYTTSRGVEVKFLSIAAHLEKMRLARRIPEVPTYELVSKLTGVVERIPLDAKTLTDYPEQFTPEQHRQWNEYVARVQAEESEYQARVMRLMFVYGIQFQETDGWVERQKLLGIEVPTDEIARRIHYIETEVMGTTADYNAVTLGVMRASGASDDLLAQVAASFRGQVQRDTTTGTTDTNEQMDSTASVLGSESGVALANDNEPMGRPKRKR